MIKGFSILGAVSTFASAVKATKEAVDDATAVKNFIMTKNSQKDMEFEKANPVPAASEPDIKQIFYFFERGTSLTVELVGDLGRFAQERLATQNNK